MKKITIIKKKFVDTLKKFVSYSKFRFSYREDLQTHFAIIIKTERFGSRLFLPFFDVSAKKLILFLRDLDEILIKHKMYNLDNCSKIDEYISLLKYYEDVKKVMGGKK